MVSLLKKYNAIVVAVFVFLACFFKTSSSSYAEELRIGLVIPLTGYAAAFGVQSHDMAKLIEQEIESAGGFKVKGKKVKVVFKYYDSESNTETGGSVTERAISDGCRIVMPGAHAGINLTASERCERAKILYVDSVNTASRFGERGFKYYFRTLNTHATSIKDTIKYLLWQEKRTGVKLQNVAIFAVDNVTGRSRGELFTKWIPQLAPHWKIVESIIFPEKTKDFRVWLNSFKAKKVDIYLGEQYPQDAILTTRQCREINYNPIAIHGDHGGWVNPEYGKTLQWQAIGTTYTAEFSAYAKIPGLSAFSEKYKRRYGMEIPEIAACMACGLTLVKDVVERAGSIEVEAMRKAMVETDLRRLEYKEGEWWWIKPYGCKFDERGEDIRVFGVTSMWITPDRPEPIYPEEFSTTIAPWPKMNWKELETKYGSQFPVGK